MEKYLMNNIRLIRVYEDDEDYKYENIFIVEDNEKSLKELYKLQKDIDDLDYEERDKKYGCESKIEIIENFIINNFTNINFQETDIDCY